jgi:1,2-phenylacetyl-CoA epoxidase catalytic subunit
VTPDAFVEEMDHALQQLLSVRDQALQNLDNTAGRADMTVLLQGALRAEFEAAEIAAMWVPSTPEVEAKLAFACQAGDEARHYRTIATRLGELGVGPAATYAPVTTHSKLYQYLESLTTTAERVAAAQLTREAIGYKSNELFIAYCEKVGDQKTAEMYRTQIQPDEKRHHEWGKQLLPQFVPDDTTQAAARKAILKTLELAEELRSLAVGKLVVETLPGC